MATLTSALSSPALQLPPKPAPWRRSIALNPRTRHRGAKPISCTISEAGTAPAGAGGKMEDYNTAMKRMMRNPYEYHHDLGMNYAIINDSLIVGSQPQKPEDINHLKVVENVAYILCLQQDDDIEYWGVDFDSIVKRCKELGVRHMRRPAKDFDPDSLRGQLPKAVSSLEWAISEGKGRVYVHCTAGLGRAPAVAIAYMFWFSDMDVKWNMHANVDKKGYFNQAKLKEQPQHERRRKREAQERNAQRKRKRKRRRSLPRLAAAFTKGVRLHQQRWTPFPKAAVYFMNQSVSSRVN